MYVAPLSLNIQLLLTLRRNRPMGRAEISKLLLVNKQNFSYLLDMPPQGQRDYYQILGVPRDATDEQIKKAFRRLAKENHPDTTKGDKRREERFKEINEAHEVLSNPDKRSKYDLKSSQQQYGEGNQNQSYREPAASYDRSERQTGQQAYPNRKTAGGRQARPGYEWIQEQQPISSIFGFTGEFRTVWTERPIRSQQQPREGNQTRTEHRDTSSTRDQYYQPKATAQRPTQPAHEGYQWVAQQEEIMSLTGRTGSYRTVWREKPLPKQQTTEGKTQDGQGESAQAQKTQERNAQQKKTQDTTEASRTETTNSANASLKVYEGDLAIINAVREASTEPQDITLEVRRPASDIRKGLSEVVAIVEKRGTDIRINRSVDEFRSEDQRESTFRVNAGGTERTIEPHMRLSEAYFSLTMEQELRKSGVNIPPDFEKYMASLKEAGIEMGQGNYDLRRQRDRINMYSHEGYGRRQEIPFGNIRSEMEQAERLVQIKLPQVTREGQTGTAEQQQYHPPEGGL